jgi:M6 family metalloprotease-like protein
LRNRFVALGLRIVAVWVFVLATLAGSATPTVAHDAGSTTKVPVQKIHADQLFGGPDGEARRLRHEQRLDVLSSRNHTVHKMLGGRHVSRLSRERLAAAGFGPGRSVLDLAAKQDRTTLRVLLVRIGFETDLSGELTSVTTDGDFQLGAAGESDRIDPPPHDKAYFEAHLAGLSEYYNVQSGGRLTIDGRVLPDGDTDCYKLSDLSEYAPGADGFWTVPLLETLVRDIIELTDQQTALDGSVNLADFDDDDPLTYVLFVHAGADWQSDIYQDSPNDIPTFFVSLGTPVELTSTDSETHEPGLLSECSIIPETTTQDGWLGSIAGALYHEFGHALGLPDIYDTSTGLPAAGYWDLMDSGPNLVSNIGFPHATIPDSIEVLSVAGLLPPSLSAWCKWYLGWLELGGLTGAATEVHLPAVQVQRSHYGPWYWGSAVDGTPFDFHPDYPQAVIGGVSPREFFLLENRWVPLTAGELPDVTGIGFVRDDDTGVFLYMGGDTWDPDGPGPIPARPRNTGMYDFFLPDGGMLVWHVNQDRIDQGLEDNTVNAYGDGLRLLEPDGIQDVGVYEAYTLGFYGSWRDPFHAETSSTLPQEGRPGTRAHDYSWTGLELNEISENTATMTFDGFIAPLIGTPPVLVPSAGDAPRLLAPASVTPWRLSGVGEQDWTEVLVYASHPVDSDSAEAEPRYVHLVDTAGTAILPSLPDGPAGAILEVSAPLAGPPTVTTFGGTDRDHLLFATRDGDVFSYLDVVAGGMLLPWWGPVSAGDTLAYSPTVARLGDGEVRLLCCLEPGRMQLLDEAGARIGAGFDLDAAAGGSVGRFASAPRTVNHPFGVDRYLVVTERRWFLIGPDTEDGAPLNSGPIAVSPDAAGRLHTAVWEQDNESRLIIVGTDGAEFVRFQSHLPVENGPWEPHLLAALVDDPAVADLDGDGVHDLVMLTATHLYANGINGSALTGFPLELLGQFPLDSETRFDGGLVVFDATGDGRNEIYATTDQGHVLGWNAEGRLLPRLPLLWGDRGVSRLLVGDAPDGGRVLWLGDTGGRQTAGSGPIAASGRMVGFLPPSASRVAGTSEWLGPLGGSRRDGASGTPADLGALSTLVAERDRFFVYPNPARGDEATFRYFSEIPGRARLTVYNLEGEVVDTLSHEGGAGVVEEIRWPLAGLASGVYMCRLDVPTADGGILHRSIRLAVER